MTKHYQTLYSYDPAQNLVQGYNYGNNAHNRLIPSKQSNRAISQVLYNTLAPQQKLHLEQSLFTLNIFDDHGNQLRTADPSLNNQWDAHNSLQSTGFKNARGYDAAEYSVYAAPGKRSRKVTETKDTQGKLIQVQESLYLGQVEYRSTWKGKDLTYDGAVIREASGKAVAAQLQYKSLRITEGHRQIAQKDVYPSKQSLQFYLDSNIDSCQTQLDSSGKLISYRANYPYGETSISFGETNTQKDQYSGQELDESGLYYYGYRSYLKAHFRWLSPDPTGLASDINSYAMVGNNPISFRDRFGLWPHYQLITGFIRIHTSYILNDKSILYWIAMFSSPPLEKGIKWPLYGRLTPILQFKQLYIATCLSMHYLEYTVNRLQELIKQPNRISIDESFVLMSLFRIDIKNQNKSTIRNLNKLISKYNSIHYSIKHFNKKPVSKPFTIKESYTMGISERLEEQRAVNLRLYYNEDKNETGDTYRAADKVRININTFKSVLYDSKTLSEKKKHFIFLELIRTIIHEVSHAIVLSDDFFYMPQSRAQSTKYQNGVEYTELDKVSLLEKSKATYDVLFKNADTLAELPIQMYFLKKDHQGLLAAFSDYMKEYVQKSVKIKLKDRTEHTFNAHDQELVPK